MKNIRKITVTTITILIILGILLSYSHINIGEFLSDILGSIGQFAINVINFLGYPGIAVLMALESMIFPLPSELVMPFAGFLVAEKEMDFALVILASSIGSIIGSLLSYWIGYHGHRFVIKFGKYLLLDVSDLEKTERWFSKKGTKTIFISRFIPVVRHLISIPAGIGKMDLGKFCIYTVLGATMWNAFLTYCGYILGKNWAMIRHYSEYLSITVAVLLVIAGIYFISRHIKNNHHKKHI